jgi:hypothetical protein
MPIKKTNVMNIFRITLKPAVRIKTKKGKRYLQLKNADGDIIHIGPTSDLENWQVASRALEDEYKSILVTERAMLFPDIKQEGFSLLQALTPVDVENEKWAKYIEKTDRKSDEREMNISELEKLIGREVPKTLWELRPILENLRKERRKQFLRDKSA